MAHNHSPATATNNLRDMTASDRLRAARLMRLATYAAVAVAAALVAIKLAAWMMSDSVSILSTLMDSLLDVAASLVNLLAVHHALQPADEEHRFGHGKAEALAGLAQSTFISGSAVFLLLEVAGRLVHPQAIANAGVGYGVMTISIIATVLLVGFQRYVAQRTGSIAIAADSVHYKMDVLVNLSVMVSLFLASEWGWFLADPLFAIAIAGYILFGAYEIGIQAYHILMDRELAEEERENIRRIALAPPDVIGVHDLRTRSSGSDMFIQLHLEMKGDMSLARAHDIADAVESAILEAYPSADVLVHQDPEGVNEHVIFND